MAWCRQAPSHYLSQCWPRSVSPYGVTEPQWVNVLVIIPLWKHDIIAGNISPHYRQSYWAWPLISPHHYEDLSLHIVSCQQVDYSFVAMAMCYQGSPLVLQITRCSLSSKPAAAAGETRMKQVKVPASLRWWCSGENLDWKKHENFHVFFIMIVTRIVLLWCDVILMLCWYM